MDNNYLYIDNNSLNYSDGVFSGITSNCNIEEFILEEADKMRNSNLKNYDRFSTKQREELAKRWENVKNLSDGKYEYYFNLEDKYDMFKKFVKDLSDKLNIKYKLEIL